MITREQVADDQRSEHVHQMFGLHFPFTLEPFIYTMTDKMAADYRGGYWQFYSLSNGGFYMAPDTDTPFKVVCENGYQGTMSADALGITVCLYAYSNLAFDQSSNFGEKCAEHYYLLREYMMDHPEVGAILAAID